MRAAGGLLLLAALATGCAHASVRVPEPQAVAIDGPIAVAPPVNRTGRALDVPGEPTFDLLATLHQDIQESLRQRCFTLDQGQASAYRLTTDVTMYEPGSAFKRWLLPGYGATGLETVSMLVRARDGASLAEVHAKGDISAGGLYTVGGFRSIASMVSGEIARSLRAKAGEAGRCN